MILPLLLMMMTQMAPAPIANAGSTSDEVVVTARRLPSLKRLQMVTRRDSTTGALTCVFKRRSGSPAMDALVCRATLDCVPRVKTTAEMRICMAPTLDALVAPGARWQADAPRTGS